MLSAPGVDGGHQSDRPRRGRSAMTLTKNSFLPRRKGGNSAQQRAVASVLWPIPWLPSAASRLVSRWRA